LVVVTGIMQRSNSAKDAELRKQTDEFAAVMLAMSKRLCIMDQPSCDAIVRDKFELAYRDAHERDKKSRQG
jgi:hypothetical protein